MQIVHSSRRGSGDIEHVGSAHDDLELELLKTVARQRLAAGQGELDLGLDGPPAAGGPLPITASRMGPLGDALSRAYDWLGFADAAEGDAVFAALVLARIIEPTSKLDSLRCSRRPASRQCPTGASSGACPRMPLRRGGSGWRRGAPTMPVWDPRRCCCPT